MDGGKVVKIHTKPEPKPAKVKPAKVEPVEAPIPAPDIFTPAPIPAPDIFVPEKAPAVVR